MQNECPNCKSVKSTHLKVSSTDGWNNIIHRGAGVVNLKVCLNCGVAYVDEDGLERIRRIEGFNNG